MIRINLLPQAKRSAAAGVGSASAQTWAVVYLVTIGLTLISLGAVYFVYSAELDEQRAQNAALQREIDDLRQRSARLEEVQAQLARSRSLEEVVAELNRARTGPLRIVMELSHVLSANAGPTIDPARLEQLRQENPLAGFNPSWDVRRLWITKFDEEDRVVTINGRGRTNEDVAGFLRRISLSELFSEVTLTRTESMRVQDVELISFQLTCKVTY
ncbi:MAG: PilN domain-containing protein [Candidatus Eisenbacteria bacterium]|nr:PilN domain-containing protein [Candidatus Eisenbacteria bacterium]